MVGRVTGAGVGVITIGFAVPLNWSTVPLKSQWGTLQQESLGSWTREQYCAGKLSYVGHLKQNYFRHDDSH